MRVTRVCSDGCALARASVRVPIRDVAIAREQRPSGEHSQLFRTDRRAPFSSGDVGPCLRGRDNRTERSFVGRRVIGASSDARSALSVSIGVHFRVKRTRRHEKTTESRGGEGSRARDSRRRRRGAERRDVDVGYEERMAYEKRFLAPPILIAQKRERERPSA